MVPNISVCLCVCRITLDQYVTMQLHIFHAGTSVLEIFITPTPTIAEIEGNDIQFACSPLDTAAPPIIQINGTVAVPGSGMRLTAEDFPGANRTYTYQNIQRAENGITLQCFTADLSLASNITNLIVYCKYYYDCSYYFRYLQRKFWYLSVVLYPLLHI